MDSAFADDVLEFEVASAGFDFEELQSEFVVFFFRVFFADDFGFGEG